MTCSIGINRRIVNCEQCSYNCDKYAKTTPIRAVHVTVNFSFCRRDHAVKTLDNEANLTATAA